MHKSKRPGLFSSTNIALMREQRKAYKKMLFLTLGLTESEARAEIKVREKAIRDKALPGERCGAYSRQTGNPCRAAALDCGRCRMHGANGGPKTPEGKRIQEEAGRMQLRIILIRNKGKA